MWLLTSYEEQCLFSDRIHTNLLTELFFLTAFCYVYFLCFPFTSHSKLEMMRYWQWPQWHFLIFSSLFKLLFQDYFILLPFTFSSEFQFVSMFLVHLFFFFFVGGGESIYERSYQIHSIWNFFWIKKIQVVLCTPHPSLSKPFRKQTRAHFILILNKGDFVVNFCYGRIYVPCLLLSPIEPIKILGICAFTIWRRGDVIWKN